MDIRGVSQLIRMYEEEGKISNPAPRMSASLLLPQTAIGSLVIVTLIIFYYIHNNNSSST